MYLFPTTLDLYRAIHLLSSDISTTMATRHLRLLRGFSPHYSGRLHLLNHCPLLHHSHHQGCLLNPPAPLQMSTSPLSPPFTPTCIEQLISPYLTLLRLSHKFSIHLPPPLPAVVYVCDNQFTQTNDFKFTDCCLLVIIVHFKIGFNTYHIV